MPERLNGGYVSDKETRIDSAMAQMVPGVLEITNEEFDKIRKIVFDRVGINLTEQKRMLVISRLQKLLYNFGFADVTSYYKYLEADTTGAALRDLVDRISTNHTFFYREKAHFDYFGTKALPDVVAKLREKGSRDLRVWSAGCSTGEEPYMLAMLMREFFGKEYDLWDAGVLATDVSSIALQAARTGIYPDSQIKLVPPAIKLKYFKKLKGNLWEVNNEIKKEVTIRNFNLMNKVFPFKKKFDVIFCRNVMIYFTKETVNELVEKFYDHTVPGGYLFVGHSEFLRSDKELFEYVMPAVYRKKK